MQSMISTWCLFLLAFAFAGQVLADDAGAPPGGEPEAPADLKHVAAKIEPDLVGNPERLPQYINFFSQELGNDSRICAFDVTAVRGNGKEIELHGFVEFPETRPQLIEFLRILGFKVDDRMEALPSERLGARKFGLVKVSHCLTFNRPGGERKQENDCLLGEPLLLLREQDGHVLAHSREGYLGYVHDDAVLRLDEAAYAKYLDGPRVLVTKDQKATDHAPQIPAGARLKWTNTGGDVVTAQLPTGESLKLAASDCKVCATPAAQIEQIIATAKRLIGTPYFWGGRTTAGVDCSGLVQLGYAAAGLHLPRDAYQQFYLGELTATRWHTAGMRRGDTLYFLGADGKIRHTAIYLGNGRYLQATMPKVRISSFNPQDPDYDARRHASFAFAKRLLD